MKKILISIMIIAVVAAIAAGGTVAYFSSSNTIDGTFSTANFDVSAASYGSVGLAFDGLIPGGAPKVQYVSVSNNGQMPAYIKATPANGDGNWTLLGALDVKVTLLGYLANNPEGGGNYPDGNNYVSYNGDLLSLYIDNVTANNPIQPGQWGLYKIEVSLPFDASPSIEGATAQCDVLFQAVQSDGQPNPVVW